MNERTDPAQPTSRGESPDSPASAGPHADAARFAHVPADRALAARLAGVLRIGLIAASVLIVLGLLWQTVANGFSLPRPAFAAFDATAVEFRSLHQTLRGVGEAKPAALMQLGVILLIALPALRVGWLLVAMVRRRDVVYATICAGVLAVLVWGLA